MAHSDNPVSNPAGEWVLALLLSANLVWSTLCLGAVRAETLVVTSCLTGVTLAIQLAFAAWTGARAHRAGIWLLPFLAYAAVNVLAVSPVPWIGKRDWLGWAQMIAVFWVALNGLKGVGSRGLVLGTAVALGMIAVVLAAYQRFVWPDWLMLGRTQADQYLGRSSGFFGNPNSLGAFFILMIPPLLALTGQRAASAVQRVSCGYGAAVMLLGLGLSISRGCLLALVGAVVCWPLFARSQNWTARILWAVTAFGAALLIGILVYSVAPSIKARFDTMAIDRGERSRPILWRASIEMFAESPVFGTGGGSFNTVFERHRPERFNDEPEWTHNEYLNMLSDYGAAGFLLSFGAVALIVLRISTNSSMLRGNETNHGWLAPDVTSALAVGLLAFAMACAVDFHLKIPSLAMLVAIISAEVVRRRWPQENGSSLSSSMQLFSAACAVGALLMIIALAFPTYHAEALRVAGRSGINRLALVGSPSLNQQRASYSEARAAFAEALAFDDSNGAAWSDAAYASALWSRLSPLKTNDLGREAEKFARQALERSSLVPEFWIRLGVSLDMQGRWTEGGAAFVRALQLAPTNSLVWYHHAYHLSLNPKGKSLSLAAVDTCLRLDPGYVPAKALRQRLTSVP